MIKYYLILLIILINSFEAKGITNSDSIFAERIISDFNKYKEKIYQTAKKEFEYQIGKDDILREYFFSADSSEYKKLVLQVHPLLKLSYWARFYKHSDNILDYVVFDDINYDFTARLFIDSTPIFSLTRGHNDCDGLAFQSDEPGVPKNYCEGDYYFQQRFYISLNTCDFIAYYFDRTSEFIFFIDGLLERFKINANTKAISIDDPITTVYYDHGKKVEELKPHINDVNKFIQTNYYEQEIRRRAIRCCPGCVPWWRFWEKF